jgi:hypothetical protein
MNINFKIEAKKIVSPIIIKNLIPELTAKQVVDLIYKTFSNDLFMLPYKVQKLSKKARRNEI